MIFQYKIAILDLYRLTKNCHSKQFVTIYVVTKLTINMLLNCTIKMPSQIEVDSGDELTEEFLMSEIHPVKNLNRPKFAKPAPPSRGNRRITKQPVS